MSFFVVHLNLEEWPWYDYYISQLWFFTQSFGIERCFTCDGRTLSTGCWGGGGRWEEWGESQLIRTLVTNVYLFTADTCKVSKKTWNVRQSGTNVSLYEKFRNFLEESPEYWDAVDPRPARLPNKERCINNMGGCNIWQVVLTITMMIYNGKGERRKRPW